MCNLGEEMLGLGSKYNRFWEWFETHEDEIFHFERKQEKVFDKLASRLRRVHPDLVFEFSSVIDGRREFTVSAGGINSIFPEVTALARAAPDLPRWQIIAFRQRQDIPEIRCGDKSLKRDAVFFDYIPSGDKIDLLLFIPGFADSSPGGLTGLKTIGYLLLDSAVGEYDVETKIAGIRMLDASEYPERRRIPLRDLPSVVDKLPKTVQ
jgi:hypothetical protein